MSDTSQGEGWWIAADGKWYPPELHPDAQAAPPAPAPPQTPPPQAAYQPPPPQAAHQPPPGYGSVPPAPQPAKKRNWLLIIGGIFLALLLLVGGCTFLVWNLAKGPIDAANEFLSDVAAQDFDAAVQHLDPSCFAAGEASAGALQSVFGDNVTGYDLNQVSNQNGVTGSAGGTITRDSFGTQNITFNMTQPADDWLVCGFNIGG